jgi:hypothetical protein
MVNLYIAYYNLTCYVLCLLGIKLLLVFSYKQLQVAINKIYMLLVVSDTTTPLIPKH